MDVAETQQNPSNDANNQHPEIDKTPKTKWTCLKCGEIQILGEYESNAQRCKCGNWMEHEELRWGE